MSKLALVQFQAYGEGLQAAHALLRTGKFELLEITPSGGQSLMIFSGADEDVEDFLKGLRYEVVTRACSLKYDQKILDFYYSLKIGNVDSHIACVEASFAGDLFLAAEKALSLGLEMVDLRPSKNLSSNGFLLLTAADYQKISNLLKDLKPLKLSCTVIQDSCEEFRSYMNQP